MTTHPGEHGHRIVVGVDGSVPSVAALAWAVRQARLTGAAVEAVIAWEFPAIYGYPAPLLDVDWGELAERAVTDAIGKAQALLGRLRSGTRWWRGTRPRHWWMHQPGLTCWLLAAAGTAGSLRRCSGRSASIACTTPPAQSW